MAPRKYFTVWLLIIWRSDFQKLVRSLINIFLIQNSLHLSEINVLFRIRLAHFLNILLRKDQAFSVPNFWIWVVIGILLSCLLSQIVILYIFPFVLVDKRVLERRLESFIRKIIEVKHRVESSEINSCVSNRLEYTVFVIDDEIFFVFVLNLEGLVVTILVTNFVNIFLFHHVQDLVV